MKEEFDPSKWGDSTKAIHGPGRKPKAYHSVSTPIVQTSNFYFDSTAEVLEYMQEKAKGNYIREAEYARYGNPTQWECERKLAALDGAERSILFSSGMSALILTLLTILDKDSHIIFTSDLYRQTRDFASLMLEKMGIPFSFVEPEAASIEAAIRPDTKVIFTETPTNPYLRVLDVAKVAEVGKRHNILTIIDATLASPYNLRPLELGIDLVVHSATKYLGGHNDLLAGCVSGSNELIEKVFRTQKMIGAMPGALTCFLLERGLKTFALRMEQHNRNGLAVARALENHPKIEQVWYPGLESHPDFEMARSTMRGFGSVLTFKVKGGDAETCRFIDALNIFLITPSLGGTESLVTQMAVMSFFDYSEEVRNSIGMTPNLVRVALGCEDVEDLVADLQQALDKI